MKVLQKLWSWSFGAAGRERTPKPRRGVVLGVEQLDERLVPSGLPDEVTAPVVFMVRDDGTWAHNLINHTWRQITPLKASVMDEGAGNTFFGAFGSGTYKYNYDTEQWTMLSSHQALKLDAAVDNTLVATFEDLGGTWEWDGNWDMICETKASDIAVVGNNHAYLEFRWDTWNNNSGIWEWHNGNWLQRSTHQAYVMDAAPDGTLFFSINGEGTYLKWAGGGTLKLTDWTANAIAADSSTHAAFSLVDSGTWDWNANRAGRWVQYTTTTTTQLHYESQLTLGESGAFVGVFNTGTFLCHIENDGDVDLDKLSNTRANLL
jgi:hypothetical protein